MKMVFRLLLMPLFMMLDIFEHFLVWVDKLWKWTAELAEGSTKS